jgi:hypothetical protein
MNESRHPREGGDPCVLVVKALLIVLDSRLRGND